MREAADKRRELEREHAEALAELQKRKDEVKWLHSTSEVGKQQAFEVIRTLESKVRELQKKCELQNVHHEELVLEMATLRRAQLRKTWATHRSLSADVPVESSRLDREMDRILASTGTLLTGTTRGHLATTSYSFGLSACATSLPTLGRDAIFDGITSGPNYLSSSLPSSGHRVSWSLGGAELTKHPTTSVPTTPMSAVLSTSSSSASSVSLSSSLLDNTSREIDRILSRIEQDNRVLAELEKSRATVGSPVSSANMERLRAHFEEDSKHMDEFPLTQMSLKSSFSSPAIDQLLLEPQRYRHMYSQLSRYRAPNKPSVTKRELDLLMAKLDQDNKILAELDKKRANIGANPWSAFPFPAHLSATMPALPAAGVATQSAIGCKSATYPSSSIVAPLATQNTGGVPSAEPYVPTEDVLSVDAIDYIDLPSRGRCKVYIARYSYDPLKQSPNENPEAELCLNAGDYVFIVGEMDEDGFFAGELLDGRRGLVPSNFVEKLTGEELFDFQATVIYGNRDSDDSSASFTYAPDIEFCGEEMKMLPPEDFHRMNDYIDLEDIEEVDEDDLSDMEKETEGPVPPPQRLILERQLNKSIMIGWIPPEVPRGFIDSYHIYVDGVLKGTIKSGERTRALIEGVDSSQPHRMSVRSVTASGQHSRDAACTIVIGHDVPLSPSCVKASNVTSTSAVISWLPSNSNFQHAVAVNSVEVRVVKTGTFRHTVTGLCPNTLYRVSVRAKPGKLLYNDERNPRKLQMLTTCVEFWTLPKGLPDPPVNIQVEAGPQDGTVLVTWLPVTINPAGTSNGAPVTGYAVYAGGKKFTEVDSPTGDHALLDIAQILPLPKKTVTVRTKSGDGLSSDSMPCIIPEELLKGGSVQKSKTREQTSEQMTRISQKDRVNQDRKRALERADYESAHSARTPRTALHDNHPRDVQRSVVSPPAGRREWNRREHYGVSRLESGNMPRTTDRRMGHFHHGRRNSAGQLIIEPDENLSDKEIYPPTRMNIPSIGGGPRPTTPTPPTRSRQLMDNNHDYYTQRGGTSVQRRDGTYHRSGYKGGSYRGPTDQMHLNNRVRWFVALFDYDPQSMSPNPDAAEEELPFQEGQLIKIYGDKDTDGFYRGEAGGRIGFVPCNMVSEVQVDDVDVAQHLINDTPHGRSREGHGDHNSSWSHQPVRRMVALYDYDPQELSPNVDSEMELAFSTGDIIYVYGEMDEDGFYMGELNGIRGLVPSNFLTDAPPDYREGRSNVRERLAPHGVGIVGRQKELPERTHHPRATNGTGGTIATYGSSGTTKDLISPEKIHYAHERGGYTQDSYAPDRVSRPSGDRGEHHSGEPGQRW